MHNAVTSELSCRLVKHNRQTEPRAEPRARRASRQAGPRTEPGARRASRRAGPQAEPRAQSLGGKRGSRRFARKARYEQDASRQRTKGLHYDERMRKNHERNPVHAAGHAAIRQDHELATAHAGASRTTSELPSSPPRRTTPGTQSCTATRKPPRTPRRTESKPSRTPSAEPPASRRALRAEPRVSHRARRQQSHQQAAAHSAQNRE